MSIVVFTANKQTEMNHSEIIWILIEVKKKMKGTIYVNV